MNSKNAGEESVPTRLSDAICKATCYVMTLSEQSTLLKKYNITIINNKNDKYAIYTSAIRSSVGRT